MGVENHSNLKMEVQLSATIYDYGNKILSIVVLTLKILCNIMPLIKRSTSVLTNEVPDKKEIIIAKISVAATSTVAKLIFPNVILQACDPSLGFPKISLY